MELIIKMKTEIKEEDVYWEMKWGSNLNKDGTKMFPDKPDVEVKFEEEMALALLLINGVVFLNSNWWEDTWPDEAKKTFSINVNTNDVFAWGCADAEGLKFDELQEVYDYWKKDPLHGTAIWAIKKHSMLPQKPIYDRIQKGGIWDLDKMGLDRNPGCPYWKSYFKE